MSSCDLREGRFVEEERVVLVSSGHHICSLGIALDRLVAHWPAGVLGAVEVQLPRKVQDLGQTNKWKGHTMNISIMSGIAH